MATLLVSLIPPGAVRAVQDSPQVFRAEVTLVRLDVSVLDQDRRPIRNLTAGDFRILVGGVPQPIVAFSPVVIPPPEVPTAPWMRDVAPDVRTNLLGEPRLFVIIMDDAVMPGDPYMIQTGKAIARAVVDQLGPGDLAAVLFTMIRSQSQDFTSDRARLLETIDRFGSGFASVQQDATIRLVPAGQDSQYELLSRVDLKPGRYLLRYSVQSQSLGRTGSVYTDLIVPDFSKSPLALSGLVLSAVPAVKAAPRDALAAILPVVPTTARVFGRSDQATAFTRVYQGGTRAPQVVEVQATLTDGRSERQRIRADQLTPAQFGSRREADYSVDLPLAALAPGPYLLSIHARAGAHSAQHHIRFVMQ